MLTLLLAAAISQDVPPPAADEETEIVVIATREKCHVRLAKGLVSDSEFGKSASEWARMGTPVRVVSPRGADYKCLAKIAFKLQDKGVLLTRWVDAPDEP